MSALISNPVVRSLIRGVVVWAPLWVSTTVLFGAMGLVYAFFFKHDTYLASQALLVRDEATGAVMRLGRFQSQAEMKAAQETILEMAKSQQVVRDALITVGPPKGFSSWLSWGEFPSKDLVEEIAKSSISVHAPKGTEFGVTEVIYMDVKANARDEALAMSKALTDALESRLQQVRKARADGVLAELIYARDSAKRELADSTSRLHEIESEAGSDLSDLRGMTDSIAGAATSRAELDQAKNDLRQAEINKQSLLADRDMLVRATQDPTSFIVAPGTILNSQPGLKRLREGLVDAQLSGSQLTGKFTENHPSVVASQSAQSSIVKRFTEELKASIAGVESDISLVDGRIQRLEAQKKSAQVRLAKLADSRAPYANLLSEVKSKVGTLESSERELAEVQAARDSSVSTSLLTRLDAPMVSDRPLGPGRLTITGLCTIAGFIFGLGIVFAVTPIDASPIFGRRSLDRERGRRDADLVCSPNLATFKLAEEVATVNSKAPVEPKVSVEPKVAVNSKTSVEPKATVEPNEDEMGGSVSVQAEPQRIRPYAKMKLNAESDSPHNKPTDPTDSLPKLDEAISHAYQPLVDPSSYISKTKTTEPKPNSRAEVQSTSNQVDQAFQELARLKSRKSDNRSDELSVELNMQELTGLVSAQSKGRDALLMETEDFPKMKPRPTNTNR